MTGRIVILVLCCVFLAVPAKAANQDVTVFPPDTVYNGGCTKKGAQFLSWYADGNLRSTRCATGQDVLNNAIPKCGEGDQVVYSKGAFTCQPPTTPRQCADDEVLTYTSHGFECIKIGGKKVPDCAPPNFLTYDGTKFICSSSAAVNVSCPVGQFLTGITNGQAVCAETGSGGGSAAGWVTITEDDRNAVNIPAYWYENPDQYTVICARHGYVYATGACKSQGSPGGIIVGRDPNQTLPGGCLLGFNVDPRNQTASSIPIINLPTDVFCAK